MSTTQDYLCSFCSKPQAQVKRLIAGPDRVFICDECVELCQQIISEETIEDVEDLDNPIHLKLNRTYPAYYIHLHSHLSQRLR